MQPGHLDMLVDVAGSLFFLWQYMLGRGEIASGAGLGLRRARAR
jgi:hypothetical protein